MSKVAVVIPNWNGAESLVKCLSSLQTQSVKPVVIVVDNGSKDSSIEVLKNYKNIVLMTNKSNQGYAGGVNPGLTYAIHENYDYVATFNNDAIADKNWLHYLISNLDKDSSVGIAASKILTETGLKLDSTGEFYSVWGLPYPRGRNEENINKYDKMTNIFAASGGASLYRVSMLKQIGLLDESFFAYYEDVDLSFRAQLAGWKVKYVPNAIVYHQIGATSGKIRGFTTYQTLKNLPLLLIKNVPSRYFFKVWARFSLAYLLFTLRALSRLKFWPVIKGLLMAAILSSRAMLARKSIQSTRVVPDEYVWAMLVHDLPPNARALRRMRALWWKLKGAHE